MIRSREGKKQRLVGWTKNTFQSEAASTQERDSVVSGRGDTVPAKNHSEPAQCLLKSVRRKLEARVLSQEGQAPASKQPDQLQRRVTQFLKLAYAGLCRSSVRNHVEAVRASSALF